LLPDGGGAVLRGNARPKQRVVVRRFFAGTGAELPDLPARARPTSFLGLAHDRDFTTALPGPAALLRLASRILSRRRSLLASRGEAAEMIWLVLGFLTSAITLHIATLLLFEEASLLKAIAVAASFWLVCAIFVLLHLGSGVVLTLVSVAVGCVVVKRLYGVGVGPALAAFLVHGLVEIAIGALLWFMFPTLVGREHHAARANGPGSGCQAARACV